MTMLIERAEARFSASIIIKSSIICLFTGEEVDCTTYTSQPRVLSSILIWISPSLNVETVHLPRDVPIWSAISSANLWRSEERRVGKERSEWWRHDER